MIGKFKKVLLTSCFVVVACEAELIETSFAADPLPSPAASVPTAPAYEHVTSHLDPNGSLYLYWNTEKLLGEIDNRLQSVKEETLAHATLSESKRVQFESGFELLRHFLLNSGLEAMKAFGVSSAPTDNGLFLSKAFLYVPDRSGYLWSSFAKPPHDFTFLKMIPENTEAFGFIDFDLAEFWSGLSKDLAASGIPDITNALQQLPAQTKAVAGMSLDDLLGSLGDQVGLIVTLDPQKTTVIPIGTNTAEIPEPAVALFLKLKNDKLFDRLDAIFSANPGVEKTDQPDLKLRVMTGNEPASYLTPALARYGDYMILSSSEKLVRSIIDANTGKSQGIRTSAEFNALSAGMPDKGNSAVYVGRRFQSTVATLQLKYNESQANVDDGERKFMKSVTALSSQIVSYKVGATTEDGWLSTAKTTKDLNGLLADGLMLTIQLMADSAAAELEHGRTGEGVQPQNALPPPQATPAVPAPQDNGAQNLPAQPNPALGAQPQMVQKARPPQGPKAKLAQIRMNLALLSGAKDQVVLQKSLKEGDPVSSEDLQPFLPAWPQPVAGETYEVGPVGQSPYATAPTAIGRIAAGQKIEP